MVDHMVVIILHSRDDIQHICLVHSFVKKSACKHDQRILQFDMLSSKFTAEV